MIKANFHQHSLFSDGKNHPEDYVLQAIRLGFTAIGFTEHSPLPFSTYYALPQRRENEYVNEIDRLKSKYAAEIKIYRALEQDFIPGITENFSTVSNRMNLDYSIGSVHLVAPSHGDELWFIDGPERRLYDEGLHTLFNGNIREAVSRFFFQTNEMIEKEAFDVLGHMDKIKMHNANRFFTVEESWYQDLVMQTLELVKAHQLIVEINTRGIYKKRSDSYFPDHLTLRQIKEMNIPVLISSDAHMPEELNLGFAEVQQHLIDFGFTATMTFDKGKWKEQPLIG